MSITRTPRRRRIGAASIIIGAAMVLVGLLASPAQADSVTPYDGNDSCADRGFANEFKIDDIVDLPAEGDYTPSTPNTDEVGTIPAGFTITIDNVEVVGGAAEFDWAATVDPDETPFPIDLVLVKASNGGNAYAYDQPGATSDTDLVSPQDSISHISFCWDGPGTTDTGTTDTGTTDTGDVLGTTGSQDTGGTDTQVKGEVVLPEQLPATGDNDASLFIIGMGFLVIGGIALVAKRELLTRS